MFADHYNNYAMNFGSDKVSDSVVNIRLGQYITSKPLLNHWFCLK